MPSLDLSSTTPSPMRMLRSRASKRPRTMLFVPGASTSRPPSTKLMVVPETDFSNSGTTPLTITACKVPPERIIPSISTCGAAAATPGSAIISSRSERQSATLPSAPESWPCAVMLTRRSRSSPSNPFITERMTISAATPRAIPASEIEVIKETNLVRRLARR